MRLWRTNNDENVARTVSSRARSRRFALQLFSKESPRTRLTNDELECGELAFPLELGCSERIARSATRLNSEISHSPFPQEV